MRRLLFRLFRFNLIAIAVLGLSLAMPLVASAQLSRAGNVNVSISAVVLGTDVGYDPTTGTYLMVGSYGPVFGVCTNAAGQPVGPAFAIKPGSAPFAHYPRAKFSPDVPNGIGGSGAFLVSWIQDIAPNNNQVFVVVVSCASPSRVVTAAQLASDGVTPVAYNQTGPAIAYSRTSHRFLVVWDNANYSVSGRFLDANGVPFGGILPFTNPGTSIFPAVAWNAATDEFGLSYSGFGGSGAFAAFGRVQASTGLLFGRTTFGLSNGTYNTDIAVNPANNHYVMGWALASGSNYIDFDSAGNPGASGLISGVVGGSTSFSLDYNAMSGTFLAAGQHTQSYEIAGVELNFAGFPITGTTLLTSGAASPGSYFPRVAAHSGAPQWNVSYSLQYQLGVDQIISTTSVNGGPAGPAAGPTPTPAPAPSGCATADPFVAIGGGHCVNGGWLPGPAGPAPTPTPTPTPIPTPTPAPAAGCATPDPFVAIGGGHCVNGGWLPGAPVAPTPPPTPTPTPPPAPAAGCTTADPFASIGGGHCVNGGWVPGPGPAPAPPPPPTPQQNGCATPDPFAAIGGGTCINGGWVPTATYCGGMPDPFVSIGGGICVNGGWIPRGGRP